LTFDFEQEAAWSYAGGGQSAVETIPSYQSTYISSYCKTYRCVPDLSFDADGYTGAWVYDTFAIPELFGYELPEWIVMAGTSLSSPALAGIVNRAGHFYTSSNAELTKIYANKAITAYFTDITYGFCFPHMGVSAVAGYDICTGVGVVNGYTGK
jgi:subtilase family serine protease